MKRAVIILISLFTFSACADVALAQASKTDKVVKAQKSGPASQRTMANGCPNAAPLACPGTDTCCPSDMPNLCRSLRRPHPAGLAAAGWSGCVRPASNESWKFWSDACAPVWEQCK